MGRGSMGLRDMVYEIWDMREKGIWEYGNYGNIQDIQDNKV
jgi:hypothetical protein